MFDVSTTIRRLNDVTLVVEGDPGDRRKKPRGRDFCKDLDIERDLVHESLNED